MNRIAGTLPFKFEHLTKGFNYLGYYLKPLGYLVKDWHWLIQRFEKRIHHWTFHLLSLGGRLVLIRVVLSSLPVYWMALAPIPQSILDKLRSMIFSFLWGSSANIKKFHLVDWRCLSLPTSQGGWGIKHLNWFSLSLHLNSFWMALNGIGIWSSLISVKYLKKLPVASWLCNKSFSVRGVFVIWNGFLLTLSWLGSGLTWLVGKGLAVRIGIDPIVGLGSPFSLT